MADYIYMMESRLSPAQLQVVGQVQEIARSHEMNVYLTGGAVRDIISGFAIRDLDFTVQGNVHKLRKDLEKIGAIIQGEDEGLRILYVLFPNHVRTEIASARSESYSKPGKPEVSFDTINEDLRRRDFTVNAMALSLNPGSRGLLMDPFNGVADLEAKHLRILQNYAFLDEPSRMLRALRLMTRFHWTLEERTQARFDAAKEGNYLENISSKAIGYEIEQIAHEDDPVAVMKAFEKEGWMKILFPAWTTAKVDTAGLTALQKTRQQLTDIGVQSDPAAARMYFLARKMSDKDVHAMQKLLPRHHFVEQWQKIEDDAKDLAKQLLSKEYAAPSATWKLLMSARPELILFIDITTRQSAVEQKIKSFLTKWPQYRQKMPLQKMAEMRITPELPVYQKLLDEMFLMMLDGKLKSEAEIVKYLEPHSPPLPVAPPTPTRRGRGKKKAAAAAAAAAPAGKPADQGTTQAEGAVAKGESKLAKVPKKEVLPAKTAPASAAASKAEPQKVASAKSAAKPATQVVAHSEAKKSASKKPAKPAAKAKPKPTAKKAQVKGGKTKKK
ncbi:MAG: polynucleotide adenylyltransferase [Acidobacteria bacterium]|nr:MAG: polynucleotide adenylyltransferase [Acidobacteriota bacterium]